MVVFFIPTLKSIHNLLGQLKTLTKLVYRLWPRLKLIPPPFRTLALHLKLIQLPLIFGLLAKLSVLVKPVLRILQLEAVFVSVILHHELLQLLTKLAPDVVDVLLYAVLGSQSVGLISVLVIHAVFFLGRCLKSFIAQLTIDSLADGKVHVLVDSLLPLHHFHFLFLFLL